jgi:hypothetical protein
VIEGNLRLYCCIAWLAAGDKISLKVSFKLFQQEFLEQKDRSLGCIE